MDRLAKVTQLLFAAIDELNEQMPEGEKVEKSPEAALYSREGKLDSLKLVNLIVAVEQRIEDDMEIIITLADEQAVSQKRSPFITVGSFTEYIVRRLEDAGWPTRIVMSPPSQGS